MKASLNNSSLIINFVPEGIKYFLSAIEIFFVFNWNIFCHTLKYFSWTWSTSARSTLSWTSCGGSATCCRAAAADSPSAATTRSWCTPAPGQLSVLGGQFGHVSDVLPKTKLLIDKDFAVSEYIGIVPINVKFSNIAFMSGDWITDIRHPHVWSQYWPLLCPGWTWPRPPTPGTVCPDSDLRLSSTSAIEIM